jgi:hypothetical protein
MFSSIAIIAWSQLISPKVAIVPVNINTLRGKWAVEAQAFFHLNVVILSLVDKLSSLQVLLENCVRAINVEDWNDHVLIVFEQVCGLPYKLGTIINKLEDGVKRHLDTD